MPSPVTTAPATVSTPVVRAAVYARLSLDMGDGIKIEDQRGRCERLARERGWTITRTYVDNGISAYDKRKVRPQYERMLTDGRAGAFDVVIAWDLDRLTRQPRQLEDWLDLAEDGRTGQVVTANGEADMRTDAGRMFARIKIAVARQESERKGKRQRDADESRAQRGLMPVVSRYRPFGFTRDMQVVDTEAEAIRAAATEIVSGATLTGVARRWDAAGFRAPGGAKRWTVGTMRGALTHPRVSALVTRHGEVICGDDGAPVRAQWEPIIDDDLRRAVLATIDGERVVTVAKRGGGTTLSRISGAKRGRPASSLLGGIARCACGSPVSAARATGGAPIYRCTGSAVAEGYTGGHVGTRSRVVADEHVQTVLMQRLAEDDAEELIARKAPDAGPLRAERQTLTARLAEIADMLADGELSREQARRANERVKARLVEIDAAIAEAVRESVLASLVGAEDIEAAWDALPVDRQRAAVRELCTITLLPVDRTRPRAERENALSWVIIKPRAAAE